MKKIIVGVIATGLLVFAGIVFAAGDVKIGVFNLQTVLQQTPQLKAVQDKLRLQFRARSNKLIAQQKKLTDNINKLRKLPVGQNSARSNLQAKIINESSSLRAKQAVLQRDILVARNKSLQAMMKKIRNKAAVVAHQKGLDLVIANTNVAYRSSSIDVTQDIVKALK